MAPETTHGHSWRTLIGVFLTMSFMCLAFMAQAQNNPFEPGWDLDPENSNLKFQSIKKIADGSLKVESNEFASFSGAIEPDGATTLTVQLDSVDTKVDLRNVRMRFLFFETFRFPEATIRVMLEPTMVADLEAQRRKTLTLPFLFDLHGIQAELQADVVVTLLDEDMVSISSAMPVSIGAAAFGLGENVGKLEQAVGGIEIVPSATVTFDMRFVRRDGSTAPAVEAPAPAAAEPVTTSYAMEPEGDFSPEACAGRFEILSRTGNIYFQRASSRLQDDSFPLLRSVVDIVRRCPDLRVVIAGHTDSDGTNEANMWLSEARAQSVVDFLIANGIPRDQLRAVGYGETAPVAPNDTVQNKSLNRRIEFFGVTI